MQIFRLSYQEITFLCLLNIQAICYRVDLHGLLACCSCLAGGAKSGDQVVLPKPGGACRDR